MERISVGVFSDRNKRTSRGDLEKKPKRTHPSGIIEPRPHRLRKTGGPGTQIENHLQNCTRTLRFFVKTFAYRASALQEMFPNVSETNFCWWNELEGNSLTYSGVRDGKQPQDVKCMYKAKMPM